MMDELLCFFDAKIVIQSLIAKNPNAVHWYAQGFICNIINLSMFLDCILFC